MQYEIKIVALIDVLGFKEKISKMKTPSEIYILNRLLRLLKTLTSDGRQDSCFDGELHSQVISDTAIYIADDTEQNRQEMVSLLAKTCSAMAAGNMWIRGAVVLDEIFVSDEVVFGPALIRADKYEKTLADVPRIVLDAKIARSLMSSPPKPSQNHPIPSQSFVRRNKEDGVFYIRPFLSIVSSLQMAEAGGDDTAVLEQMAVSIRANLEHALVQTTYDPSVFSKVRWFERKWTETIINSSLSQSLRERILCSGSSGLE